MDGEQFDYIIVGAGSAGCVLANRLSADPNTRVLVLEAGGRDNWIWFHVPAGFLYAVNNPRADWCYVTEKEKGLAGRSIFCPRGKVIGGSSTINAMVYIRGQAADYDHWRQLGLAGWGWDDVLPFFKRQEDYFGGADEFHGAGGNLHVQPQRAHWTISDVLQQAGAQAGIGWVGDFNRGDNEGMGLYDVTQRNGRRWSSGSAFLKPALKRPNVKLESRTLCEAVTFEGKRATGIRYKANGAAKTARARREVLLSSGSIGSAQLLLLSGVGPGAHLAEHGIKVVLDKPGVGGNFHDHLQLRLQYRLSGIRTLNERYNSWLQCALMGLEYALLRRGPLSMAPGQLGMFVRSHPSEERADLGISVVPYTRSGAVYGGAFDRHPGLTMSVYDLRPTSRGTLRLKSPDPAAHPALTFNYLDTERDQRVAANSIRVIRRIVGQPALAPYRPEELMPGPAVNDDESALRQAAAEISTTIFHPVGSAKMGLPSDPTAVVDERLKVIGLDGLRVVDASVMPMVTSGNTNAPTMMIAEKGAAMILEDAR
jgi:choline dehydrogenase-like flavoprotein